MTQWLQRLRRPRQLLLASRGPLLSAHMTVAHVCHGLTSSRHHSPTMGCRMTAAVLLAMTMRTEIPSGAATDNLTGAILVLKQQQARSCHIHLLFSVVFL
uniref:Putative secreted protein n=1 Tax=Amblyomma americanum TaxID=6943 RepID=A0A0C9SCS9_AMBAM